MHFSLGTFSASILLFCQLVQVILAHDQPNIIVILTDDQDAVLNGMMPMTKTQELLVNNGASFVNAFTTSPICCPSRASILSGRYPHNHETRNNSMSGGCYSDHWRKQIEPATFPAQLKANGYQTFYAGKYLNQYRSSEIPPGYDDWYGLHGNSRYYNYTLNENGILRRYGNAERDYLTDVLSRHILGFLDRQQSAEKPFFAMITPPAPHAPFTPAPRHNSSAFANITAPRTPNFNIASQVLEKHWLIRMPPAPLTDDIINRIDQYYRSRWQTLLAVDDMIEAIIDKLQALDLYDSTYVIFASDHGYHLGQFSMPYDKRQPYETDIRVPFVAIGPDVLRVNHEIEHPIALIDIAPTVLELAKVPASNLFDGQSFAELLRSQSNAISRSANFDDVQASVDTPIASNYERKLLIEYWGEGTTESFNPNCPWRKHDRLYQCSVDVGCHCIDSWNNTYACIRHMANDIDKIYCEFDDEEIFVEAYDLTIDPHQMNNIGFDMLPSERNQYSLELEKMKNCAGASCQKVISPTLD